MAVLGGFLVFGVLGLGVGVLYGSVGWVVGFPG